MNMKMEVVELKVRLHCKACQKALRKSLCKIKGVKCVEIDAASHKITELGYVERKVVVKAIPQDREKSRAMALIDVLHFCYSQN